MSAETGSLFAELMGGVASVNYGGGEGKSSSHSLKMGVASAALASGMCYGQSSSGTGLQGIRPELIGLMRAQSLFSRVEPLVETNELVRQGIEILECRSSESDEIAAERLWRGEDSNQSSCGQMGRLHEMQGRI